MSEADLIKAECETKKKWELLHLKILLLVEKKPEITKWENMSDETLQWWIDFSLKNESYLATKIFREEQEKRKNTHGKN